MISNFIQTMANADNMPENRQRKLGQATSGKMGEEHEKFLHLILKLLQENKIDLLKPDSILNREIYDRLPQEGKAKVDAATINMVRQLQHIVDFRLSPQTPNESSQLQTMIEHLWNMKAMLQEYGNAILL